jgi:hypothetical protein
MKLTPLMRLTVDNKRAQGGRGILQRTVASWHWSRCGLILAEELFQQGS